MLLVVFPCPLFSPHNILFLPLFALLNFASSFEGSRNCTFPVRTVLPRTTMVDDDWLLLAGWSHFGQRQHYFYLSTDLKAILSLGFCFLVDSFNLTMCSRSQEAALHFQLSQHNLYQSSSGIFSREQKNFLEDAQMTRMYMETRLVTLVIRER